MFPEADREKTSVSLLKWCKEVMSIPPRGYSISRIKSKENQKTLASKMPSLSFNMREPSLSSSNRMSKRTISSSSSSSSAASDSYCVSLAVGPLWWS